MIVPSNKIKFACPYCGQPLEADCDMIGMTFDCPTCGQLLKVPTIVSAKLRQPPPATTVIRKHKSFTDQYKKWLKVVGIGVVVLILFVSSCILTSDDKEKETVVNAALTNESLIDRLRRLKFDVKVVNEKGGLVVSDTGVDEPVFITEERSIALSRGECVAVFKSFGPCFVRDRETIYKMKKLEGWDARFEDSKYTFLYVVRIEKGVSDKKLTSTIRDVQRQNIPFQIDAEYQTRWSIIKTIQCFWQCVNDPNEKNIQSLSVNLKTCPDDFQKAMIDMLSVISRPTEDMVTTGGNLGMLIGSMNEDNPQGGAVLGGLLGAIVGAAKQEEAAKEQERVLKAKFDNILNVARNYGADPNNLTEVPYGWGK